MFINQSQATKKSLQQQPDASFVRNVWKASLAQDPVKLTDSNNNNYLDVQELKNQPQAPEAIAKDMMSVVSSKDAKFINIGEIHNAHPMDATLAFLKELRAAYPNDKLAFGMEFNEKDLPQTVRYLKKLSQEDLATLSPDLMERHIRELTSLMQEDVNALYIDIAKKRIAYMMDKYPQYKNLSPEQQNAILNNQLSQMTDLQIDRGAEARLLLEAKRLGYDLFGFNTSKREASVTTYINDMGKEVFGLEEPNLRETQMTDNVLCQYQKGFKRVVTVSGTTHGAVSTTNLRSSEPPEVRNRYIPSQSMTKNIKDDGYATVSFVIVPDISPANVIDAIGPEIQFNNHDAIYSSLVNFR